MLALSIQNPWAYLIANGLKDIENRSWSTTRRGRFLIHAGLQKDMDALLDLHAGSHPVTGEPWVSNLKLPEIDQWDDYCGSIIGVMEISECVQKHESPWFVGPNGFVIKRAWPLNAPIQCRGMLGFFKVPDGVAAEVTRQLAGKVQPVGTQYLSDGPRLSSGSLGKASR